MTVICSFCKTPADHRVTVVCHYGEALVAQGIEQGSSKPEVAGSIPAERATLRDDYARAIWLKRPDCLGRPFPPDEWADKDRRAYPHNPIAALDLCWIYADAILELPVRRRRHENRS